jgi:hypothetical protein
MDKEKHFLCTGNISKVNTGHFLIRNSEEGIRMMNAWTDLYEHERWKLLKMNNRKKFVCTTPEKKKCSWSGRYYEQGDFVLFIIPIFNILIYFDPNTYPEIFWNCDTNCQSTNLKYQRDNKLPFVVHLCDSLKTLTGGYSALNDMGLTRRRILSIYN